MISKKVVRKVLVGVVIDSFCDQDYLRDRDYTIPLYEGETDATAISLWCEEMKNWIRADEKKYVKVIREVGEREYAGSMLYRKMELTDTDVYNMMREYCKEQGIPGPEKPVEVYKGRAIDIWKDKLREAGLL